MGAQSFDGPARASSCTAQKQISTGESNFERDVKAPRQTLRRALRSGYLTIEASFLSPGRLEKQDARKTKISDILLKGDVMTYEIQTRLLFSDVYRPDFGKVAHVCLK